MFCSTLSPQHLAQGAVHTANAQICAVTALWKEAQLSLLQNVEGHRAVAYISKYREIPPVLWWETWSQDKPLLHSCDSGVIRIPCGNLLFYPSDSMIRVFPCLWKSKPNQIFPRPPQLACFSRVPLTPALSLSPGVYLKICMMSMVMRYSALSSGSPKRCAHKAAADPEGFS